MKLDALLYETGGCRILVLLEDGAPSISISCDGRENTVRLTPEAIPELLHALTRYLDAKGATQLLATLGYMVESMASARAEVLEEAAKAIESLAESLTSERNVVVDLPLPVWEATEIISKHCSNCNCYSRGGRTTCTCKCTPNAAKQLREEVRRARERAAALKILAEYAASAAAQARMVVTENML